MSNPISRRIDRNALDGVRGGASFRGFVEGARKLYNTGVAALHLWNPTHTPPPPRIPDPPRIERPVPSRPQISSGGAKE